MAMSTWVRAPLLVVTVLEPGGFLALWGDLTPSLCPCAVQELRRRRHPQGMAAPELNADPLLEPGACPAGLVTSPEQGHVFQVLLPREGALVWASTGRSAEPRGLAGGWAGPPRPRPPFLDAPSLPAAP